MTTPQTKCMSTICTSHLRHNEIKMLQEVKYLVKTPWSLLLHLNLNIVYITRGQEQTSVTTVSLIWRANINKIQGRISCNWRCILLKVLTFIFPLVPEGKVFLEQSSANVIILYFKLTASFSLVVTIAQTCQYQSQNQRRPTWIQDPKWAQWEFSVLRTDKFGCRVFGDSCLCLPGLPGNKEQMTAILSHGR